MRKALFPGSFDPITIGHLDIIKRASKLYDEVYVGIMINEAKDYLFNLDERLHLCELALADFSNVRIVSSKGLTVNLCKDLDCKVIIKGIRTNTDFEYELNQANINNYLAGDVETILLFSKPEYSSISSSIIKDIWRFNGDIKAFLPEKIYHEVVRKLKA